MQRAAGTCRHQQILEHRHRRERARDLVRARDAEAAARGGIACRDVVAGERDAPGGRWIGAGQHVEQRGFAGTVRPDDADRFTRVQRESPRPLRP
jgi:hypothetical protein